MEKIQANWFVDGDNVVLQLINKTPVETNSDPEVPIDIVFCQDVSGSMGSSVAAKDNSWYGTKLQLCQETQKFVVNKLKNNRLGLVTFDSSVREVYQLDKVSSAVSVNNSIMSMRPGSCTNLSGGLHAALKMMSKSEETTVKYLVVFTDGLANEGIITEDGLRNLVKENTPCVLGGMNLVILGYGKDCNNDLLQRMADEVEGSYHYLSNAEDIPTAIGEEFGTALQTRQQNLSLKTDPAVAECVDYISNDGILSLGDLLQSESRNFLFEIHDREEFSKQKFVLSYLDCESAKSYELEIETNDLHEDHIIVGDAVNIRDVTITSEKASKVELEERKQLLQECVKRIAASSSAGTETSKRLLEGLHRQIEFCNTTPLAPPACLRSFSSATKKQRGGVYSTGAVADFRDLSVNEVSSAVSMGCPVMTPPNRLSVVTGSPGSLGPPILNRQITPPPLLTRQNPVVFNFDTLDSPMRLAFDNMNE